MVILLSVQLQGCRPGEKAEVPRKTEQLAEQISRTRKKIGRASCRERVSSPV